MHRLLRASLIMAALFLAACAGPAYFEAPISELGRAEYDQRLVGTWYSVDTEDGFVWLLDILPPEEESPNHLSAVLSFTNTEPATGWYFVEAYASEIDGTVYYNARITGAAEVGKFDDSGGIKTSVLGEFEGFMIIQAGIDADGLLSLRVLSTSQLKAMKLKSREMICTGDCDEVLFELSSGELVELIRTNPRDELFDLQFGLFARMETGRPVFSFKPSPPSE